MSRAGSSSSPEGHDIPPSASSASLSSSFSSAASSMLLPAAAPSNSSQSDIVISDHSASLPLVAGKNRPGGFLPSLPRASPTSSMGEAHSRPQPLSPSSPSSQVSDAASSGPSASSRFKRAFAGRRRKSDNASPSSTNFFGSGKSKPQTAIFTAADTAQVAQPAPSRHQLGAKQLTLQLASHVFNRKHHSSPASPAPNIPPPPLPSKAVSQPPLDPDVAEDLFLLADSPSVVATLNYIRKSEEEGELNTQQEKESGKKDEEKVDMKDARRKSDSTMSHHTIRPGFTLGNRSSRPVSMAESLQSIHTIVPTSRRLSAFVTEAENIMPEEEDLERSGDDDYVSASFRLQTRKTSPPSSIKIRNRRSKSLNLGAPLPLRMSPPEVTAVTAAASVDALPTTNIKFHTGGLPASPSPRRIPTQTPAAGLISPTDPPLRAIQRGHQTPGILNAAGTHSTLRSERTLPELPGASRPVSIVQTTLSAPLLRQTAISITSGLAPAAGLARKAVERMGRVWGARNASSGSGSSTATGGSSSTAVPPSSYLAAKLDLITRTSSNMSEAGHKLTTKSRRHKQQPSGSWSIGSSTTSSSASDTENFSMSGGPVLGKRLRVAMRPNQTGAPIAGGLVFGRDLKNCVRDTATDDVKVLIASSLVDEGTASFQQSRSCSSDGALESRFLPALVVRCVQHIIKWGVQEQGLFRVSGRMSHIAKLRTEFDVGCDYDIAQCSPVDLDPHAVAAILKAYLRELPEPILTHALTPYFDAAMATERDCLNAQEASQSKRSPIIPGMGFTGLRKPPSLSTLSAPGFASSRIPSESLRKTLSALIARLPRENRDLLLTVTEVVNATAKRSQETKMPLSNLLLVLCPSLNMNPTLLQALCQSEGIWDGSLADDIVVQDIATHLAQSSDSIELSSPSISSRGAQQVLGVVAPAEQSEGKMVAMDDLDGSDVLSASEPDEFDVTSYSRPLPELPSQNSVDRPHSVYMDSCGDTSLDDHSASSISGSLIMPNYDFPPSLSSSAESLRTPSTSSVSLSESSKHLPLDEFSGSQGSNSPLSPAFSDPIRVPLHSSLRRPTLQSQFRFPSAGDSAPSTPISRRKSLPLLSLPSLNPHAGQSEASSVSSRSKGLKRPSIHLLFPKRPASPARLSASAVSLSTPVQGHSRTSSTSTSSPESMVTAPQQSRLSFPPVLNTTIDSSSLRLELGLKEDDDAEALADLEQDHPDSISFSSDEQETSIAAPSQSSSPSENSHHDYLDALLGKSDTPLKREEEDWAQSVLVAASTDA